MLVPPVSREKGGGARDHTGTALSTLWEEYSKNGHAKCCHLPLLATVGAKPSHWPSITRLRPDHDCMTPQHHYTGRLTPVSRRPLTKPFRSHSSCKLAGKAF